MIHAAPLQIQVACATFIASQILYSLTFIVEAYFFLLPVNSVDLSENITDPEGSWPNVVLFYPVLRELETTMRTTLLAISRIEYPTSRRELVAIPNHDDYETIASLERLSKEFSFLRILPVPSTSDPTWNVVWNSWRSNRKAYWWHSGRHAAIKDLPAKKTRQLIYAFYTMVARRNDTDFVVNYIDADSCPPVDHFRAAAIGLKRYDVLQSQNVAGNLLATMPATWHAMDHMAWDGFKYPHLSSNGFQPFWVLGKGLFFRAADLVALGGFNPWITIEDPEVGLRFWANGKRLGIVNSSLIEEVPETWHQGITQRKRWVCGFFQTLSSPLTHLGLGPWDRFKCWLIFAPCLSLFVNVIGMPFGLWALWALATQQHVVPMWTLWLAFFNIGAFSVSLTALYVNTWRRTALVLGKRSDRLWYMFRVNPISLIIWWLLWIIPLVIGLRMFIRNEGLTWDRTVKIDANSELIRKQAR